MIALPERLREVWTEPPQRFSQRVFVENHLNQTQRLHPLWQEQAELMAALATVLRILVVKPRQMGASTIVQAFLFAKTYRSPHARKVLQIVHEEDAQKRFHKMLSVMIEGLPPEMRWGTERNSVSETIFSHNGAAFRRVVAGARGQGRSWTYNDIHSTEMAHYPTGSSSVRGTADSDVFASAQSTLHDPTGHVIVESTGNGPRGKFFAMASNAMRDPAWRFVFIPWTAIDRYEMEPWAGFELTTEEEALSKKHDISRRKMAWRRWKLTTGDYTPTQFRKEYPLHPLDPFSFDVSGWFDQEQLGEYMHLLTPAELNDRRELRIFEPPVAGETYYIGMDCAGGTGRDESVIVVLRSDLWQVAHWSSSRTDVPTQALRLAELAKLYNNALCLVETNNMGLEVLERARMYALRLWTDEEGGDWYSTGGRSSTKRKLMVFAREILDAGHALPKEPETIRQLQNIVEKPNGKIEARMRDEHDDRGIALCLAIYCAQRWWRPTTKLDAEKERLKRQLAWRRQQHPLRRAA